MQKITPFLWYDGKAGEAAEFYTGIFKNAKIISKNDDGMGSATIELEGQQLVLFNGGPMFKFTEAVSLMVSANTQEEIDELWKKLTADGGNESMCGWLKDKFGFSWQIVPPVLLELMKSTEPGKAQRVVQAMLKMKKLIIKDLVEA
jgi:predicted 3-demethylubiquinone-9 3-methyltransferase (glyoxalase superfamily)